MDRLHDHYQAYSWHQSHDQATVLLLVPYETLEDDVLVMIERNHLVAGVRGQPPIVKGRLYGNVDTANSMWQLEPRASRSRSGLPIRDRTTSTTSTASTQSSYAVLSDPEISSSFAASLDGGFPSDVEEPSLSSPALSSPISSSVDEQASYTFMSHPQRSHIIESLPSSPPLILPPFSVASSYSSVDSLRAASGRLLTLHLEKAESVMWPSLVVGPVPESLSPSPLSVYPWASSSALTIENIYNMDPTSLVLMALDLYHIREAFQDAFEYFVRAWHQAHVPLATIRLATHYLPMHSAIPIPEPLPAPISEDGSEPPTEPSTPTPLAPDPIPGTLAYYVNRIGGTQGLAQLYLSAGVLHLEGAATQLLSSTYMGLSSLRAPLVVSGTSGHGHGSPGHSIGSTEAWRHDRECARQYFERARALVPVLDVPLLPPENDSDPGSGAENGDRKSVGSNRGSIPVSQRRRAKHSSASKVSSIELGWPPEQSRRRRKKESGDLSSSFMENYRSDADDDDRTWYLYLPGLVGAGTALLVVGFLSFSSWRRTQGN
ncbi:uncharacterized protein LAESUDRAFT_650981 [Laetiporus sulphureus 93-53]|uniref:CS domain-containing protein n=1 Tax=Laetiporus sulphureus 93-53 TaxID=1314785 RepID=A0A165ERS2_9APHY|nr:uncharacterized protein LAESUDRAFT_650981 [Laetiporus sulphureus 93-53]KZT07632.1 hypothetical protein LAESUDRAFT_650981 [Laetiporus sulphureus 93-53]